jgi:hypothetical protein
MIRGLALQPRRFGIDGVFWQGQFYQFLAVPV